MKKLLFLLCATFLSTSSLFAGEPVNFTASIVYDWPLGHGPARVPLKSPTVSLEDHTLSFVVNHPDYMLSVKDEDDNVVYSTFVFSAQTEVMLPSALSGDYKIELVMDYWKFTGWINL